MSSVSPLHEVKKDDDAIKIKDVSDSITQNINPLIEDYLKKILVESTTQAKLCENPILVSVDEIEKANKIFAREEEQKQVTPTAPPQFSIIQPTLPLVVYQRKETDTPTISTMAHHTLVSVTIEESIHDKGETNGK